MRFASVPGLAVCRVDRDLLPKPLGEPLARGTERLDDSTLLFSKLASRAQSARRGEPEPRSDVSADRGPAPGESSAVRVDRVGGELPGWPLDQLLLAEGPLRARARLPLSTSQAL